MIFFAAVSGVGVLYTFFNMAIITIKEDYFRYQTPLFCQVHSLLVVIEIDLLAPVDWNIARLRSCVFLVAGSHHCLL